MGRGLYRRLYGRRLEYVNRKRGVLCPFPQGELGPYLTQCLLGQGYLRTKWHPDSSNRWLKDTNVRQT